MVSRLPIFLLLTAVFLHNSSPVDAAAKERTCKELMAELTKRLLAHLGKCVKKLGLKTSKDKAKKMNCIIKCGAENEGLISPTGEISRKQIDILVEREVPPSMQKRAYEVFMPCVDKYEGTIDPDPKTDPDCKTYEPPSKCLMASFPNFCPEAGKLVDKASKDMEKEKAKAKS